MSLQEAIYQTKPFTSIHEEAMVNIMYTYGWILEKNRRILKPFGVTPTQYNILRILRGAGKPVSTSYIKKRLLDKNSDVSRAVDRLVVKGWVIKNQCPSDRRLIDVELAKEGSMLMAKMQSYTTEVRTTLSNITEEEARLLSQILDKIRNK
jgi:DNA-binding MarR family transcriptional regulator